MGNSVDVKMFETTRARVEDNEQGRRIFVYSGPVKTILKQHLFDHHTLTMSVIVEEETPEGKRDGVYVKGAFEQVKDLCTENVPEDYDAVAKELAQDGGYVLALAYKPLNGPQDVEAAMEDRTVAERNLHFLGLLVFENRLKGDTKEAIRVLSRGGVHSVMVTGDNLYTGARIGRECGLVSQGATVLYGKWDAGEEEGKRGGPKRSPQPQGGAEEEKVEEEKGAGHVGSLYSAAPARRSPEGGGPVHLPVSWWDEQGGQVDLGQALKDLDRNIELAIPGGVFRKLLKGYPQQLVALLPLLRVYGRMLPNDKVDCVKLYMRQSESLVGMVGDGGNDYGALRQAHVGLALSDSEAAIVSPFTSTNHSIHSVVNLLREGRANLASSVAAWKFMIAASLVLCFLKAIHGWYRIEMNLAAWLFLDVIYFLTLLAVVSLTPSAKSLSSLQPTSSLFGRLTVGSIVSMCFVNFSSMGGILTTLTKQPWYLDCQGWDIYAGNLGNFQYSAWNYESTVLNMFVVWQVVNCASAVSYGLSYRIPWFKNYPMIALVMIYNVFVLVWALVPSNVFTCCFGLNCASNGTELPREFR